MGKWMMVSERLLLDGRLAFKSWLKSPTSKQIDTLFTFSDILHPRFVKIEIRVE